MDWKETIEWLAEGQVWKEMRDRAAEHPRWPGKRVFFVVVEPEGDDVVEQIQALEERAKAHEAEVQIYKGEIFILFKE